ncbi:hypothetical protein QBC34DRAFT_108450 [Podospora aff. communis PSN243]|uniref:Uncharacterized protein n=1 Tax=Podospora aff. communis PSN243 TaxID=3040156 RepID=A0AAV9H615_9PEZI|nr:hypothetical protein QBC34DRAFT_108450 [Podospora aff. communis PSN243]
MEISSFSLSTTFSHSCGSELPCRFSAELQHSQPDTDSSALTSPSCELSGRQALIRETLPRSSSQRSCSLSCSAYAPRPNLEYFSRAFIPSLLLQLLQPWAAFQVNSEDTQTLSQVCGQRRPDIRAQMHRHTCALARRCGSELQSRAEIGLVCICPGGRLFLGMLRAIFGSWSVVVCQTPIVGRIVGQDNMAGRQNRDQFWSISFANRAAALKRPTSRLQKVKRGLEVGRRPGRAIF